MPVGGLLPELALLLGAVACILLPAFTPRRVQSASALVALAALALAGALALAQWDRPAALIFAGVWAVDPMTVAAKLAILVSAAAVVLLSPEWLRTDRRHGEYYGLLLFAVLGAVMMASATDTMELVLGVLLSSAAGYPLAAYHRAWPPALEAGMKFYLVAALANVLLALGVVLLFGLTGETGYRETAAALGGADPLALGAAAVMVLVGLAFKMGAFPAHAWMPDVAQGSPASSAAFLTVVPKIGAAVALARFVPLLPPELGWRGVVAFMAVVTMTLGNLAALRQDDVRRLLGWSSVSQSGYALMAVVVVGAGGEALAALLVFLAGYAAANLAAFAVVVHWRGRTALQDYGGIAALQPLPAVALILALLSLVGVPPLIGFFGKLLLFQVVIEGGYAWLAAAAAANTVVSLYYYLRVIAPMVFAAREGPVHRLGPLSGAAALALGALVLGLGLGVEALLALAPALALLP